MQAGKVKKLVSDKGFGFITGSDGKDIFFHKNGLVGVSFDSLKGGEEVQYEVEQTAKGANAKNVSLAG